MSPARYAQHFLVDNKAIQQIVESVEPEPTDSILEIGPGRGILTKELLPRVKRLVAVEVDPKMIQTLQSHWGQNKNLTLIQSDILQYDLNQLIGEYKVVGNLPYNITSPILRKLSHWTGWKQAWVMVQKEVADRLCAVMGTKAYGAITVGMSLSCSMEKVFDLSADSFRPRPRVLSSVVYLKRHEAPLTENIDAVQKVIQAAFQQRRKTILNSLSHGLGLPKDKILKTLEKLGLSCELRPERISVEQFVGLSNIINPNHD